MERIPTPPTFTDLTLAGLGGRRSAEFFSRCQTLIPFDRLAQRVSTIFVEDCPKGGAPHWPVVQMLKILFVQKCYGLSDPQTEEALLDRISFRRFVGLSFDDKTPDQSTIWFFRERLEKAGHGSTLFDTTVEMLREQGVLLETGTLIDATLIEAPLGTKREDGTRTAQPCATHTAKGNRAYFGYRAHIATERQGFVMDYIYDTACVSEHTHFDALAEKETRAVFADSGCRSRERVGELRGRGVVAGLCHRRVRGQKELTPLQKRLNRIVAGMRAFVEHPFAGIKKMLPRRARYRTLRRNALDFGLCAMIHNWRLAMPRLNAA
jgi:transposase, IS5 family